jgi:hypothetical protein
MDPVTLATAAVAFVTPFLIDLGKDAAKEAASDAGKSVWSWVQGKLTSPAGAEAVADVQRAPEKPENALALQAALAKALTRDRGAAEELASCSTDTASRPRRRP